VNKKTKIFASSLFCRYLRLSEDMPLFGLTFIWMCAETEEGFVKVRSQRGVMIDQTVRRDVDLDDVLLPSVTVTRFTQLKHFVKVNILMPVIYSFIVFLTFSLQFCFYIDFPP